MKNYKLKYSRLLTCYSALLYLLALHAHKGTVSPEDAAQMIQLSPTERLQWLLSEKNVSEAHTGVIALIESYERFLLNTAEPETSLVERFLDRNISKEYFTAAANFGDKMFEVIETIGGRRKLHRLLVV